MKNISFSVIAVPREPIMKTLTVPTVPPVQKGKLTLVLELYGDHGVGMVSLDSKMVSFKLSEFLTAGMISSYCKELNSDCCIGDLGKVSSDYQYGKAELFRIVSENFCIIGMKSLYCSDGKLMLLGW